MAVVERCVAVVEHWMAGWSVGVADANGAAVEEPWQAGDGDGAVSNG